MNASRKRMDVQEAERLAALWCAGQPIDDLPQWRTAMQVLMRELSDTRASVQQRVAAERERLADGGVLVRLHRPDGYEDVHPVLVAEDAIRRQWPRYDVLLGGRDSSTEPAGS